MQPSGLSVELSALIGSIYECALDPSRWKQTLAQVQSALEAHTVVLHLNDLQQNAVIFHMQSGAWMEPEPKHVAELHGMLPVAPSVHEPFVLSRHQEVQAVAKSAVMREWLAPQGVVDLMQLFILHTPTRFSGVGVAWHHTHGPSRDNEIDLARLLQPHLRRAVAISDVLDLRTIERRRFEAAVDALRCAVIMVNRTNTILYANRAAEDMLREGHLLTAAGGMLSASQAKPAADLRNAIAKSSRSSVGDQEAGPAVRLTANGSPAIFAHVLPLFGAHDEHAVAAVFVEAKSEASNVARALTSAFDLTPAETRVAAALLDGADVQRTAMQLGLAASTVKTHLNRIFFKTGTARQADLQRLAASLVPPLRPTN